MLGFPQTTIAEPAPYEPPIPSPLVYSLKEPEELPDSVLCNCYAFVKREHPSLPSTWTILTNVTATGTVAVFYYEKAGLHHYATLIGESDTHYLIEETNYERCKKTTRWIPKNYPRLVGFFNI